MANLSTFGTIHEKVKRYNTDYELNDLSLAFEWLALETLLNLNEDEIQEAITDGSNDAGIDAIHIIDRTVYIFSFKYARDFDHSKNNFPANDIDKLIVAIEGIYSETIKQSDVNGALWEKINEIWKLLKESRVTLKLYLCSNKEKPVQQAIDKMKTILDKYKYVEYFFLDQEDIVSKIIEKKYEKLNGTLRFIDKQYFERSDGPLKGIVATVAASELIDLIKDRDDPMKVNENAFNENVRVFLKLKNRINQGIFETAISENNFEFWYLNNGINILCEECSYTPNSRSPIADLKNFQIVNGGQTTHALFEAYLDNKEKLDNVLVLVRICETKQDYEIAEKISETTNSQTPVNTRDLHANDRIQRKLEEQFKSLGYYYERKRNQFEAQERSKRLNNELMGQICLAYYHDMASEAKNQKTIVFGEKYDEVFDEEQITAEKMLLPYRIYLPLEKMKKDIQGKKREKDKIDEKEAFVSRATFHILNAVKLIASKETLDLSDDKNVNTAIQRAIQYIGEVVRIQSMAKGDLYTHDKFFKEIPTNRIIKEYVLGKYSVPSPSIL